MQNPNQNNADLMDDKQILVYCKRFHPVTKVWTYGHVLIEAELKYLYEMKRIINFDEVDLI